MGSIVQKLQFPVEGPLKMAERYISVISVFNELELAPREIQLLAYTAVNGNIGSDRAKEDFVKIYGSSLATVGNIISRLTNHRMKLLIKEEKRKVVINPALMLDFKSETISLVIIMKNVNGRGEQ